MVLQQWFGGINGFDFDNIDFSKCGLSVYSLFYTFDNIFYSSILV